MKKIVILICICLFLIAITIVLYYLNNTNAFVGKWNYNGGAVQSIIDNNNGNIIQDTKIIKNLEINNDNKYTIFYENGQDNGTYSINNNEIILLNDRDEVIDRCVLNNNELTCDFYSSFTRY